MATARSEILEAFRRLERRTGQVAFGLAQIVSEVKSVTTAYKESTIRTHVVSVMCADAPVHHFNHTDDLRRVAPGKYARIVNARVDSQVGESAARHAPPPLRPGPPVTPAPPSPALPQMDVPGGRPWYWEGNVQSAVVTGLSRAGWQVRSVSDTESRAQGTDVIAVLDGRRLHVEVKGYPTDTYARGEKVGEPKPTHPATQARVWFSGAFLKAAMLRNDHPSDAIAMAFPLFETYATLANRISLTLQASSIGLIWVHENGAIDLRMAD